ncbi:hypothetical protein B0H11DRAFT_2258967 [Mycena galericulata]|nr:hypothetical protein B0H11DRAFT_2258967 [Mycena galericulata]
MCPTQAASSPPKLHRCLTPHAPAADVRDECHVISARQHRRRVARLSTAVGSQAHPYHPLFPPISAPGLVPIFCGPGLAVALRLPPPPSAFPFLLRVHFGLPPPFGFQRPGPLLQLLRSAAGGCNKPTNEDSISSSPLRAPFHSPRFPLHEPLGAEGHLTRIPTAGLSPPRSAAPCPRRFRPCPLTCTRPGTAPTLPAFANISEHSVSITPSPPRASAPASPPFPLRARFGLPPPFGFQRSAPLLQLLSSAAERWDTPTNIDGISPSPLRAPFRSPRLVCGPRASPRSPAPCTVPSRYASLREPRGISPAYPQQVSALVTPLFRAYVSFGPAPLPALAQALRPTYPPMQLSHGLCIAHSHLLLAP